MINYPPSLSDLKTQAKRLRNTLQSKGDTVSHGRALELIAHQHGYRDWNTLYAALGNHSRSGPPVAVGEKASGHYLGQAFSAEVIGVHKLSGQDRYRVTMRFDEPVDVVRFDSFSALRQRVSSIVNRDGVSSEKTSDGQPHMRLAL